MLGLFFLLRKISKKTISVRGSIRKSTDCYANVLSVHLIVLETVRSIPDCFNASITYARHTIPALITIPNGFEAI